MDKDEVKEYLKTQYDFKGFIEHTMVAEMCLNYSKYVVEELQKQAERVEDDFKESGYSLQEIIDKIIIDILNPE